MMLSRVLLPSNIGDAHGVENPQALQNAQALQKAQGLDTASAAHAARAARKLENVESARDNGHAALQQQSRGKQRVELEAAATVSLSGTAHVPPTYSRPTTSVEGGEGGALVIGDNSSVQINSRVSDSAVAGSLVIGENSSVHINSRITDSAVAGSLVIGDNSSVQINSRVTGSGIAGSLVIGDNSSVHINSRITDSVVAGSLAIGDNSSVHVNSRITDSVVAGSLAIGDNAAVHINSRITDSGAEGSVVSREPSQAERRPEAANAEAGPAELSTQDPSDRRAPGTERNRRDYVDPAESQVNKRHRLASPEPWPESPRSGVIYMDPRLGMMNELIESTLKNADPGELTLEKAARNSALQAHGARTHSEDHDSAKAKNEPDGPARGRPVHLRTDTFG